MAATRVEAAFILIDRASGPIRRIRRELKGMERDAVAAGAAMDSVAAPKTANRMEERIQSLGDMRGEVRGLGQDARAADRGAQPLEKRFERMTKKTNLLTKSFRLLGSALRLIKWPAVIAGAGGLLQVVGGLAGGVTALLPVLGDLSGGIAGLGSLAVGAAVSFGVFKLATNDLGKALGGNKEAIKGLTTEGRSMLKLLKEMQPEVKRLRSISQQGIFPGMEDMLKSLKSHRGDIRKIVKETSKDLGGLFSFGAKQMNTPGFFKDMVRLARQGSETFGAAARSGFYLARAMSHMLIAARPLTRWMGQAIEGWSKQRMEIAKMNRETGKSEKFFERTRRAMERVYSTGKHTIGGLLGIMRAARGQSEDLWKSMDGGAGRFDKWANSFGGQNAMRQWFANVRPALDATVKLVGSLGAMIGRLSQGPEGAAMIESLGKAMPSIEEGLSSLTSSFGPAAVEALGQGVRLMGVLAQNAGPLTLVARAVGLLAGSTADLIQALGPAGSAMATFGLGYMAMQRMGAGGGIMSMLPFGGRGGKGGAPGGGIVPPIVAGNPLKGGKGGGLMNGLRGAKAGGFGGAAMTGARGLGRAAWPIALAFGAMDAATFQGNVAERGQAALSGATFGLIPQPLNGADREIKAQTRASKFVEGKTKDAKNARDGRSALAAVDARIAALERKDSEAIPTYESVKKAHPDWSNKQAIDYVSANVGTKAGRDQTHKDKGALIKERRRLAGQVSDAERGEAGTTSNSLVGAYNERAASKNQGPEVAMEKVTREITKRLKGLGPTGKRVLSENMLQWAAEQKRLNPKLADEYDDMRRRIKRKFRLLGRDIQIVNGRILDGSSREWAGIGKALSDPINEARAEIHKNLTAIQREAVGSLQSMGFSKSEAKNLVQNMENGKGNVGKAARKLRDSGTAAPYSPEVIDAAKSKSTPAGTGDGVGVFANGGALTSPSVSKKKSSSRPSSPASTGGGNLMGANPALGGYAREGAKFGLSVSSGARPGAVTKSGNSSYHSSGDALDLSGGAKEMLGFAKYMVRAHGPQLEELIHTPMGFGIKGGKKVPSFGAIVDADHYDHVHVADTNPGGGGGGGSISDVGGSLQQAMSVALNGPGSKLGGMAGALSGAASAVYAKALEGALNDALGAGGMDAMVPGGALGAVTMPGGAGKFGKSQLEALWIQAGGPSNIASLMASIALAESGGNASITNNQGSGATGLWQILGNPFPGNAKDPLTNAKMAVAKYQSQGLGAWEAYTNGNYRRYQGDGPGRKAGTGDGAGVGGGTMVNFAPQIQMSKGMGKAEMRTELMRYVDELVAMVGEEMENDADEDAVLA